ncbi:3-methyl-2-oxobutanoate hydroxymethyltransferase [Micromonospora rosaria]|uniref:3-methyl-2-oxobutanoate hydroxymethyltransferase n=1 Tax=Micromonospora rosaria TaxID=47874 RepID=A0A136PVP7_9ACTN|nr:isocitrate lyase/phosphoenolpyruvate mutase family protein [Micromonospora rosaria]KXK62427.1 3-methyl-2-oxobutanoate hydroxymethyltransferase [Micromonospora rosaria]
MTDQSQVEKARTLRALHEAPVLVLPNAWDAASAALVVQAGAAAVATTSGGVAWSLGRTDGEGLTRAEMTEAVRRIAAAVRVPVTADIEGGYGPGPEDVAATVRAVVEAGAVGINLEDSRASDGTLYPTSVQVQRIEAARNAAAEAGLPDLFVNLRTDVYLFGIGAPDGRLEDVQARADQYAKAGADGLFVPGLLDLDVLASLTASTSLPVNAMAGAGGPSVAELVGVGVRRISVGTGIAEAAYGLAQRAARELLETGTYRSLDRAASYADLNGLFTVQ